MKSKGVLLILSGFSGAGKGTLVKKLLDTYPEYSLSVSMTTRQPRDGEVDGVHYFFATPKQFEEKIEQDGFIEYAQYCENYYGTPKDYVEEKLCQGKNVILEIELQGALKVKEKYPEAVLVFVVTKSAAILKDRLVGRGTETMDIIEKRMKRAVEEAEYIKKYDYMVVNDDLNTCMEEIHSIIENCHRIPSNNEAFIAQMKEELKAISKGEK